MFKDKKDIFAYKLFHHQVLFPLVYWTLNIHTQSFPYSIITTRLILFDAFVGIQQPNATFNKRPSQSLKFKNLTTDIQFYSFSFSSWIKQNT